MGQAPNKNIRRKSKLNHDLTICRGFIEDNPSGTLTKEKMLEMYGAILQGTKAKVFVDQIFAKFDSDNSGSIDFKVTHQDW